MYEWATAGWRVGAIALIGALADGFIGPAMAIERSMKPARISQTFRDRAAHPESIRRSSASSPMNRL